MKLVGLAAIFICTTLVGVSHGNRLKERALQLGAVIKLLHEIETMISYQALSLYEIFRIALENKNYEKLKFIEYFVNRSETNDPFLSAFQKAVEKAAPEMALKNEDIAQLLSFASGLGTTDTEGQIKNCRLYLKLFQENLNEANNVVAQKQKLYCSLGVFAGLFIAVFFI